VSALDSSITIGVGLRRFVALSYHFGTAGVLVVSLEKVLVLVEEAFVSKLNSKPFCVYCLDQYS